MPDTNLQTSRANSQAEGLNARSSFYIRRGKNAIGPLTVEQLQHVIRTGQIGGDYGVSSTERGPWKLVKDVRQLADLLPDAVQVQSTNTTSDRSGRPQLPTVQNAKPNEGRDEGPIEAEVAHPVTMSMERQSVSIDEIDRTPESQRSAGRSGLEDRAAFGAKPTLELTQRTGSVVRSGRELMSTASEEALDSVDEIGSVAIDGEVILGPQDAKVEALSEETLIDVDGNTIVSPATRSSARGEQAGDFRIDLSRDDSSARKFATHCPHCSVRITFRCTREGLTVRCPNCEGKLRVASCKFDQATTSTRLDPPSLAVTQRDAMHPSNPTHAVRSPDFQLNLQIQPKPSRRARCTRGRSFKQKSLWLPFGALIALLLFGLLKNDLKFETGHEALAKRTVIPEPVSSDLQTDPKPLQAAASAPSRVVPSDAQDPRPTSQLLPPNSIVQHFLKPTSFLYTERGFKGLEFGSGSRQVEDWLKENKVGELEGEQRCNLHSDSGRFVSYHRSYRDRTEDYLTTIRSHFGGAEERNVWEKHSRFRQSFSNGVQEVTEASQLHFATYNPYTILYVTYSHSVSRDNRRFGFQHDQEVVGLELYDRVPLERLMERLLAKYLRAIDAINELEAGLDSGRTTADALPGLLGRKWTKEKPAAGELDRYELPGDERYAIVVLSHFRNERGEARRAFSLNIRLFRRIGGWKCLRLE